MVAIANSVRLSGLDLLVDAEVVELLELPLLLTALSAVVTADSRVEPQSVNVE